MNGPDARVVREGIAPSLAAIIIGASLCFAAVIAGGLFLMPGMQMPIGACANEAKR